MNVSIYGTITISNYIYSTDIIGTSGILTYQWQDCSTNNGIFININGATNNSFLLTRDQLNKFIKLTVNNNNQTIDSLNILGPINQFNNILPSNLTSSYLLTQAQSGKYIKAIISYTDKYGNNNSSYETNIVGPILNVNDPMVQNITISGLFAVGNTINIFGSISDIDGISGSINWQWQSCSTIDGSFNNISGATLSSYILTQSNVNKFIRVNISYKDNFNNDYLFNSNMIGPIGNFIIPPTNNYNSSIVLSKNEVGYYMKLQVTYTDRYGMMNTICSNIVGPVANVDILPTGTITISGLLKQNQILTITNTICDLDGISGAFIYQWNQSNISGGITTIISTSSNITLNQTNVNKYIQVNVSYSDNYGTSQTVSSNIVGPIVNTNDPPTGILTISGLYAQGETLVILGTISDIDGISGQFKYQWQSTDTSNGTMTDISGGTISSFLLTSNQVGKFIRVIVSYTDNYNTVESIISNNIVGPITIPIENLLLTNITSLSGILSYEWQQVVTISGFANNLITSCYNYILTQSLLNNIFNIEVKYIDSITKVESKINKKIGPFNIINTISDMVINANLIPNQSIGINGLFDNLNYQWYQLLSSTGSFGCKTKSINTLLTLTEEQSIKLIKLKISVEI